MALAEGSVISLAIVRFPFLTPPVAPGISFVVIRAFLSAALISLACLPASAQVALPPEVEQSAVAAVKELGQQVVVGNHKVAIDRMYQPWKERLATQVPGGMKALEETMAGVGQQMAAQGISILSFRVDGKPTAYEVDSGKEEVVEDGRKVEKMIFKKWLILVPTLTEIRIMPPAKPGDPAPKSQVWASSSFQVAISDKGKNDWTFIDGSKLRVSELRRLFFNLPENLALPEIKAEEKKVK